MAHMDGGVSAICQAAPLNAAVCEDRRARRAAASRVMRRTTSPAGRISWEVFFFQPLRRPHRERLHGGRRFGLVCRSSA